MISNYKQIKYYNLIVKKKITIVFHINLSIINFLVNQLKMLGKNTNRVSNF